MSLIPSPEVRERCGIQTLSFNQDGSCLLAARDDGYSVYNVDPFRELVRRTFSFGGVSHIAMLYRTSLLALVFNVNSNTQNLNEEKQTEFAGMHIDTSALESTLFIYDDATEKLLGHISYPSPILKIALRHDRLLVTLENSIHVHSLTNLQLIDTIPTAKNPSGLMAVSTAPLTCPLRSDMYDTNITSLGDTSTSTITPEAASMASRLPFVLLPTQEDRKFAVNLEFNNQNQNTTNVAGAQNGAVLYDKFCGIVPISSQLTALHHLHSFIVAYPSPHVQGAVGIRYYYPSLNANQVTQTRLQNGPVCVDLRISNAPGDCISGTLNAESQNQYNLLRRQIDSLPKMLSADTYIEASKSPLGCISISENGAFLAVTSTEGTLIRVYDAASAHLVATWRRGKDAARITSIVFDSNNSVAVVSSSKGTAHVFSIDSSPTSMTQSDEADAAVKNAINTFNISFNEGKNNEIRQNSNIDTLNILPEESKTINVEDVDRANQEFLQRNSMNLKKAQQYYGGSASNCTVTSNTGQFLGGVLNNTADIEKKAAVSYRQLDEKVSVLATFSGNICTLGVCNDKAEFHKVIISYQAGTADVKVKWLMCENELLRDEPKTTNNGKKKKN